ncbi:Uncharacterized protein APZ42_028137 [Daphnia magna]|uniref:Uncharacterized protein n=1 Tax=Daphnia magna TaxID=35525 RepID=A0A164QUU1_9CRUS|nr:Uncharacterized protein APZ42_028137 [Daphnia magna]
MDWIAAAAARDTTMERIHSIWDSIWQSRKCKIK